MTATTANTALLRVCSLLLCLVAGSTQLSIEEFVVPKAVELGSSAELRCEYGLSPPETDDALYVKWWWKSDTAPENRKQLYQRITGRNAESIQNENFSAIEIRDNDTIVLLNVTTADSGIYECEVWNIAEIRKHDTLIVYYKGSGPKLNIKQLEDEDGNKLNLVQIECEAADVAPEPSLSVKINNENIALQLGSQDEDQDGLYSIYGNATYSTVDTGELDVRCELYYSDPNIIHPSYEAIEKFTPAGYDTQSTTEVPDDTTEPAATPESLQNAKDDGVTLQGSWLLMMITSLAAFLQTKL